MSLAVGIEVFLPCSPREAFECWTQRDVIKLWWGADGVCRVGAWVSDVRSGGGWQATFEEADGSRFTARGDYNVVQEPHCVAWTWWANWNPDTTLAIMMTFTSREDGTHFKFACEGFRSKAERDEGQRRWSQIIGWLEQHLSSTASQAVRQQRGTAANPHDSA